MIAAGLAAAFQSSLIGFLPVGGLLLIVSPREATRLGPAFFSVAGLFVVLRTLGGMYRQVVEVPGPGPSTDRLGPEGIHSQAEAEERIDELNRALWERDR